MSSPELNLTQNGRLTAKSYAGTSSYQANEWMAQFLPKIVYVLNPSIDSICSGVYLGLNSFAMAPGNTSLLDTTVVIGALESSGYLIDTHYQLCYTVEKISYYLIQVGNFIKKMFRLQAQTAQSCANQFMLTCTFK